MANDKCDDSPSGKHDWEFIRIIDKGGKQAELFICLWCGNDRLIPI